MTKLEMLKEAMFYIEIDNGSDFFQEFIVNLFDGNYFGEGTIKLFGTDVDIESVWTDKDNNINIHVSHPEFEGDILMKSLSEENQLRIVQMMRRVLNKK